MTKPIILFVDDDPPVLNALDHDLRIIGRDDLLGLSFVFGWLLSHH